MEIARWFCWTGAAEDGRAPTEERSCVRGCNLLFDGAADDNALLRVDGPQIAIWDFAFWAKPGVATTNFYEPAETLF